MMLHVEESGPEQAPLVVLVHGSMDRCAGFARVARRLGHLRVVRYDRRGYGRSRPHDGPFGMDQQVADLLDVLAGRKAVLVGHSYGGNIAMATAARHPRSVRAVGTYESPLSWLDWWPSSTAGTRAVADSRVGGAEEAGEQFLRRMLGGRRWEGLPERTKHDRRAEGVALVGELADLKANPPWAPGDIHVPVVVGCGELSRAHHRSAATWIAEHVPGADFVEFADAHHGAHLSHPAEFAAFVEHTVARVGEHS